MQTRSGWVGGLLAFADTEFSAHLLRRELARHAEPRFGGVGIKRTNAHPGGASFDVAQWRQRVEELPQAVRDGGDLAGLTADR